MTSDNHQRLYVLDESSLASTRNIHRFFERVGPHDKVLLVGDTRQHQAVEAGSPFEQLQRRGMETARLTEVVRQRDPKLKKAVEKLSAKEIKEAVRELQSQGRIMEIADGKERLKAIAAEYCRRPENTLVISPANRERVALNAIIRRGLQQQGLVSREEHRTGVYVNRQDMTGTERTFALSYMPGEDVIRYGRKSRVHGISAGDYARVLATDHGQNTVTVRLRDGREVTYNPARLQGVSVYREGERSFAEGDRVQFRAPFPEQRAANGELGLLERIDGAQFTVALEGGRRVSFDSTQFRHLDHGYAVTSYSSQGQTVDRVIVNADTRESEVLLNQRTGYVAVSRAKEDALIYTNSQEELGAALEREVDKQMGLEAVQQATRIEPHAETHDVAKPPDRGHEVHVNGHSVGVSW